ncbi:UNVERIFIED_CONTAM: hypothetical protein Scaly_2693900, partial [Sesamum calycinum]
MEAELSRLGYSLVLMKEEDLGVVLLIGVSHSNSNNGGFHTIGCVLSLKPYHVEALKMVLKSSQNPAKGMEINFIENDRFLLKFFHFIDHDRVLASGPWAFEKNLIVLAQVSMNDNPAEVDLTCNLPTGFNDTNVMLIPKCKQPQSLSSIVLPVYAIWCIRVFMNLKRDISKVCDRMEWLFLLRVLAAVKHVQQVLDMYKLAFGVRFENKHDVYLGLPMVVFRSKMVIFAALKDRVWKRIQG